MDNGTGQGLLPPGLFFMSQRGAPAPAPLTQPPGIFTPPPGVNRSVAPTTQQFVAQSSPINTGPMAAPVVPKDANQNFGAGLFGGAVPPMPFSLGVGRSYNPQATPHQVSGLKDITPASQPKLVSDPASAGAVRRPVYSNVTPNEARIIQGFMPRQPLPMEMAQGDLLGQFKGKLQADLAAAQGDRGLIDKAYADFGTNAERILSNNFGMLAALRGQQDIQ